MPSVAVSPDGKLLVVAGDDTVLRWYDTTTWQKTREYRGFMLETFALAFTPDGKSVLAGGADSRITVFDVGSGKQVRQLPPEAGSSVGVHRFSGRRGSLGMTQYFDNAGEKPPHAAGVEPHNSEVRAARSPTCRPTCGELVGGKIWTVQLRRQDADHLAARVVTNCADEPQDVGPNWMVDFSVLPRGRARL